jgi:hypothetical protein
MWAVNVKMPTSNFVSSSKDDEATSSRQSFLVRQGAAKKVRIDEGKK